MKTPPKKTRSRKVKAWATVFKKDQLIGFAFNPNGADPQQLKYCEDGLETGAIVTIDDARKVLEAIKKHMPPEAFDQPVAVVVPPEPTAEWEKEFDAQFNIRNISYTGSLPAMSPNDTVKAYIRTLLTSQERATEARIVEMIEGMKETLPDKPSVIKTQDDVDKTVKRFFIEGGNSALTDAQARIVGDKK